MQQRYRPLSAGEIIGQSVRGYFKLWPQVMTLALVLLLPPYLLSFVVAEVARSSRSTEPAWALVTVAAGGFLALASNAALIMAVTALIGQVYLGQRPDWRRALRTAGKLVRSGMWVILLISLIDVGVALVAALAAGIRGISIPLAFITVVYTSVTWCVVGGGVVFDGVRGSEALARSFRLVRGRWWGAFGSLLGVGLVCVLAALVLGVLAAIASASAVISVLLPLLLAPMLPIAQTFLYFDLRNRHGGFDPGQIAGRLGGPAPGGLAPSAASSGGSWPPAAGFPPPRELGAQRETGERYPGPSVPLQPPGWTVPAGPPPWNPPPAATPPPFQAGVPAPDIKETPPPEPPWPGTPARPADGDTTTTRPQEEPPTMSGEGGI